MAFDWLSMVGPAVAGGSSLASMFMSPPENPYLKKGGKLIAAATDPTSRRFQNQAALIDEQQRGALIGAINDMIKQTNRAKARGDVSYGINPERRDEAKTMALLEAFARAKINSRLEARDTLLRAGNAMMQGAYTGADLNDAQRMNQQNIAGSMGGLAQIIANAIGDNQQQNPVFDATGYQTNYGPLQLAPPRGSQPYYQGLFS